MEEVITVKEAAEHLNKHPGTVRRWIREGKLPARKLAGKYGVYLISRSDLLELMMREVMQAK